MFKFLLPTMIGMLTLPFLPAFFAAPGESAKTNGTRSVAGKARESVAPSSDQEASEAIEEPRARTKSPRSRKTVARATATETDPKDDLEKTTAKAENVAAQTPNKNQRRDPSRNTPEDQPGEDAVADSTSEHAVEDMPESDSTDANSIDSELIMNGNEASDAASDRADELSDDSSNHVAARTRDSNASSENPNPDSNQIASTQTKTNLERISSQEAPSYLCLPTWTSELKLKPQQLERLLAVSQQYASRT